MKRYADKKEDPHKPEQLAVLELRHTDLPQESGVRVDCFRAGKDLEIAHHVRDHEADESDASDRHHDLLPDHRVPEGYLAVADSHASRRRDAAKMDCRIQILWVLHINLNSFGVLGSAPSTLLRTWFRVFDPFALRSGVRAASRRVNLEL